MSTNGGEDWTLTSAPQNAYYSLGSSSDGQVLAAAGIWGLVSTNGGAFWLWVPAAPSAIALSRSGRAVMGFGYGQIVFSVNSGASWFTTAAPVNDSPHAVAVSGDGSRWLVSYGSSGSYLAKFMAPTIVIQLTNQVVAAGLDAELAPGVAGAEPFSYQWTFGGAPLLGATNGILVLPNVDASAAGQYAVIITNRYGSTISSNAELSVVPALVRTLPAGAISATSASLVAESIAGIDPSELWFDWGIDATYGNKTTSYPVWLGRSQVWQGITGLDGEVVYHYRAAISNSLGTVFGEDQTVQVGLPPQAVSLGPAPLTTNTATLRATVNPQGRETLAWFRWWESGGLPNAGPLIPLGHGAVNSNLTYALADLKASTVYYSSILASNSLGAVTGSPVPFVTGPWFPTAAPEFSWTSVASSADGWFWAGASSAGIFTSTNRGLSWISNDVPTASWKSIAVSADGKKLAAAASSEGIYISSDSGATWFPTSAPAAEWTAVACSADGVRLLVVDSQADLLSISTNSGLSWTSTNVPGNSWQAAACSADGNTLLAASRNGVVYVSTNVGVSWQTANLPGTDWYSALSCSGDARVMIAAAGGNEVRRPVFVSTNFGATWSVASLPASFWCATACSADGHLLLALARGTGICISSDGGLSWSTNLPIGLSWKGAACSADGAVLIAASDSGPGGSRHIYSLQGLPAPRLHLDRVKGETLLSWVAPSLDFRLERAADPAGAPWFEVPDSPGLDLSTLQYRLPVQTSDHAAFYRLRH